MRGAAERGKTSQQGGPQGGAWCRRARQAPMTRSRLAHPPGFCQEACVSPLQRTTIAAPAAATIGLLAPRLTPPPPPSRPHLEDTAVSTRSAPSCAPRASPSSARYARGVSYAPKTWLCALRLGYASP